MSSVTVRREIAASRDHVWKCLSEPERVTEWFADTAGLGPGGVFRFDFGDGDYFAGTVTGWEPPALMQLEWRFMSLGRRYRIGYQLAELGPERTAVVVEDVGSRDEAEAASLTEGWGDFLDRLSAYATTGRNARYEWSQTIGTGAWVAMPEPWLREVLRRPAWWQQAFDGFTIELLIGDVIGARFRTRAWGDVTTIATIEISSEQQRLAVGVKQDGFVDLPPAIRVAERRRVARMWERALRELEERQG